VTYRLLYTRRATKDIQKLDPPVKKRVGQTLQRYARAPLEHAEKLTNPELGSYRFRIGDYRVIFDLQGEKIVVLRVGHRRDIYKR
jgi:mRNA interferase RelE/StbE